MLSDLNSESSPVRGQDLKSSFGPNQAKTSSQLDLEAEIEDQERGAWEERGEDERGVVGAGRMNWTFGARKVRLWADFQNCLA